jgi:hypothetical protein
MRSNWVEAKIKADRGRYGNISATISRPRKPGFRFFVSFLVLREQGINSLDKAKVSNYVSEWKTSGTMFHSGVPVPTARTRATYLFGRAHTCVALWVPLRRTNVLPHCGQSCLVAQESAPKLPKGRLAE